ncbi:MAG: hypothetical protein E7483_00420 [Ruminococcaceae bacterium]|nr:hypothetical protein [Oscillospiraceae bacterium]
MRLKPVKEKISIKTVINEMFSKTDKSSAASICIDVDGGIVLENFRRIIDYKSDRVAIETRYKFVYIYGSNLSITYCDKHFASACGDIEKIEIFSGKEQKNAR